jgi:hypothetical protein
MDINESVTVVVAARRRWNDTGIDLHQGQSYLITAAGKWLDWNIETSPSGYGSKTLAQRLVARFRRLPPANWFALVGAVDGRRDSYFAIGQRCEYLARRSGRLSCFANDVWLAYFNNHGQVEVTVQRLG